MIEAALEHAGELVVYWTPHVLVALLILLGFWLVARLVDRAILRVVGRTRLNALVVALLSRSAHFTLLVFGIVTALGTLGINISAIVAGLGLTGFALGFALRDTISNLLAGVLLLVYRPFDVNQHIQVSGFEGTVIHIDLRYTTLESPTARVLIPNAKLFTDPITVRKG